MLVTDSPAFAAGMMLAGLAAGMIWYGARLKKQKMPARAALLAAVTGSVLALLCAKTVYLLHDLGTNLFEGYFDEVFRADPETFSFAGGCAGFVLGTALAVKLCGIRPAKALDLFAAPGCVFLCLARIAEGGMDAVGLGNEVEAEWLKFFPMTLQNSWGDAYLSVFVLEALTALVCLIPAMKRPLGGEREGLVFERTAVCLLGAQIGWEMLLQYPYIRTFITSFVSLDQVVCAVLLIALMIRGCIRGRRWMPLAAAVVLLGLSAFFQFFRDNKISFLFEEGWEWALDNAQGISLIAFFLISAGLIAAGLKAVAPGPAGNEEKCN